MSYHAHIEAYFEALSGDLAQEVNAVTSLCYPKVVADGLQIKGTQSDVPDDYQVGIVRVVHAYTRAFAFSAYFVIRSKF